MCPWLIQLRQHARAFIILIHQFYTSVFDTNNLHNNLYSSFSIITVCTGVWVVVVLLFWKPKPFRGMVLIKDIHIKGKSILTCWWKFCWIALKLKNFFPTAEENRIFPYFPQHVNAASHWRSLSVISWIWGVCRRLQTPSADGPWPSSAGRPPARWRPSPWRRVPWRRTSAAWSGCGPASCCPGLSA